MSKVREHGEQRNGPGRRRAGGATLAELRKLVQAMPAKDGARPSPTAEQVEQLCRFLNGLTDPAERARVVAGLIALRPAERKRIRAAVVDHAYRFTSDGPTGPGAPLLEGLRAALEAWPDTLPEPEPVGGRRRTAEEWRSIHATYLAGLLVRGGWPETLARAAADDLTCLDDPSRSVEDWTGELRKVCSPALDVATAVRWAHDMGRLYAERARDLAQDPDDAYREWLISSRFTLEDAKAAIEKGLPEDEAHALVGGGMSPEDADAAVTKMRRDRKWSAATAALAPATIDAAKRKIEDAMRQACPVVAALADKVAGKLVAFVVKCTAEQAASLRDGLMGSLAEAICSAMQGGGGIMFETVQREHPAAAGHPRSWDDLAFAASSLADAIAEGAPIDAAAVTQAARGVQTIADEARTWEPALRRVARRPRETTVDAAVALSSRGYRPAQIVRVLDHHEFPLKAGNATPSEAVRQAVKTRSRRTGTK